MKYLGPRLLAVLLPVLPASAQDIEPIGLIDTPVYADPSSGAPVIGHITDLTIADDHVVEFVVEDGKTRFATIQDAQIFLVDGAPYVVIDPQALADQPTASRETLSFRDISQNEVPEVRLDQQALDLTFYGDDAARVLVETLVEIQAVFGIRAFRTVEYTVEKGDTICSIYAKATRLPLNSTRCPAAVATLNDALNPETRLQPETRLKIPQVEISSQDGNTTDLRSFPRGVAGSYTIRLPVTTEMAYDFYGHYNPSNGISVNFTTGGAGEAKATFSGEKWVQPSRDLACAPEPETVSVEKSYYYLFGWLARKGWQPSEEIRACAMNCESLHPNDPGACADIVLVDQPARKIPELAQIHFLDRLGLPLTSESEPAAAACQIETFDRTTQHGTHLASIIDSRADGRGFVGMSPGLNVFSYPWITGSTTGDLQSLIAERIGDGTPDSPTYAQLGPQVFVFASHFPSPLPHNGPPPATSYPEKWREENGLYLARSINGRPTEPADLRQQPTLQKSIANSAPYSIWVVAAMQKDPDAGLPHALEIDESLAFSPVNLGDLPNVIVVTACDRCEKGNASIWPDAFFGKKFVQVAAPGLDVIAPVAPGELAEAGGTSQAAAIVGGLVGAMLNCYPERYRDIEGQSELKSDYIKQRLQYTSNPIFYEEADLAKVAAGVVDPEVALLDPSKTWIRMAGEDDYQEMSGDADVDHWCLTNWTMIDGQLRSLTNSSKNILRMTRIANPNSAEDTRSWVIYALVPGRKSEVIRFDPRNFQDPNAESQPLLARADGTFLHPKDFDDLVLAHTLRIGTCQPG
jgi:subtilisin family serine protease